MIHRTPPIPHPSAHSRSLRRWLLSLLAVLILVTSLVYWRWSDIQYTLSHWTGEDVLVEQIKGVGAMTLIALTSNRPNLEPLTPIRHSGISPYGINTFLEQEADPDQVDRSLEMISTAGFAWIRQEFPWEDIEIAGKGDYWDPQWQKSTWEKYDRIVDLAEHYDLDIIARLDNPPAWSREMGNTPGWTMAPPDDYADFADYCAAVINRYKGRIRYYQIWNEPNIYPEWGDQPADAAAYVEMLQLVYARAKATDPDCVIIAAGLAQTTEETPPEFGPRNVSDLTYLERMYQAGVQGHFDVMGAQVYGLWTGPYDYRMSRDRSNFSRVQMLREIMVKHGDADKPIWATEVGWNALPEHFDGPANYGRVSPERQAIYATEAYQRASNEWPWMGVMNYWFFRRPSDSEMNQSWYYFRMVEPDFSPLPVYDALTTLTQRPPVMHKWYHQEDHWALNYDGDWRIVRDQEAVLGAYAQGQEGASVSFSFKGRHLALVLREPEQKENLLVTVDGRVTQIGRPTANGIAKIRGYRSTAEHAAALYILDDIVGLDGIIVSSPPQRGWWGAAGAIIIASAWWISRRSRRKSDV